MSSIEQQAIRDKWKILIEEHEKKRSIASGFLQTIPPIIGTIWLLSRPSKT